MRDLLRPIRFDEIQRRDQEKIYYLGPDGHLSRTSFVGAIPVLWEEGEGKQKALFLDRDGVVIEDKNYLCDPHQVVLIEEMVEVMLFFQKKGYLLFIVSNQSGIGRGLFSEEEHLQVTKHLDGLLKERGVHIVAHSYSPYYEKAKDLRYQRDLFWRKPYPGMVYDQLEKYDIALCQSLMIGDKNSDQFLYCPLKTYLVKGQYELMEKEGVLIFENHTKLKDYFFEEM